MLAAEVISTELVSDSIVAGMTSEVLYVGLTADVVSGSIQRFRCPVQTTVLQSFGEVCDLDLNFEVVDPVINTELINLDISGDPC